MSWFCFRFRAEEEKADGGKDDELITVVLKVNRHCDGCAKKVKRSVTGFKGVEGVTLDNNNNKLTVVGKLNPEKIRSSVENKIQKKVELVSPLSKKNDKSGKNKEGSGRIGEKDQANGELINVDPNKYGGAYVYMSQYPIENVHHPFSFSHENSNVCSVM